MKRFRIHLFRQFCVTDQNQTLEELKGQKARELLAYLIVNHHRPHLRGRLASLLWQDSTASQSKQYFRQTLWHLQSALNHELEPEESLVSVDADWIRVNAAPNAWIDIHEFEHACARFRGRAGSELSEGEAETIRAAVRLYRGDLLEDWYQDWVIFERERLRNIYLATLDRLVDYCESAGKYEEGIAYGNQLLKSDCAHERSYRRLMRLTFRTGNRTGALRLFERCRQILQKELDVAPSPRTLTLRDQIKSGRLLHETEGMTEPTKTRRHPPSDAPADHLERLILARQALVEARFQVDQEIETLKALRLKNQPTK